MKLGERGNVGVEAIPTGALVLDLALGIGGGIEQSLLEHGAGQLFGGVAYAQQRRDGVVRKGDSAFGVGHSDADGKPFQSGPSCKDYHDC